MRIAASATKGKGRRYWAHGQASSCNPLTKKFRSKAKPQRLVGDADSGLTVAALATHNALSFESLKLTDTEQSEKNTINTFASIWSRCTNPDFEHFLSTWTATCSLKKEMLAVLGTATETITEKGGQQGTTEYFLVLMTMLEEVDGSQKVSAIVELLRIIIGKVSIAVLRHGFDRFASIFSQSIGKYSNTSNLLMLRGLIHCFGLVVRSLDCQGWTQSNLRLLDMLLLFAVHADINVRKSARRSLTGVIGSNRNDPKKTVANCIATSCVTRMNEASVKENVDKILHLMQVLRIVTCEVSASALKTAFETLLSFMTLENAAINTCALEIIGMAFNSNSSALTMQTSVQIFNALFEFMPHLTDTEVASVWIRTNKDILSYWKSDASQLSTGACRLVKAAIPFFAAGVEDLNKKLALHLISLLRLIGEFDLDLETVSSISLSIDSALDFKYQDSWSVALTVVAAKFEALSAKYPAVCIETLKTLKTLRQSQHFNLESDLDRAVGAAVRYLGPESVMQVIELDITADGIRYAWILPILKQHIHVSSLSFFARFFIPMAQRAKQLSLKKASSDEISSKHLEMICNQIWSLLPGFCSQPNDIASFSVLAPTLGKKLREDVPIRSFILSSLRNLVKFVEANDDDERECVAKYSKNFFPILLNIYTTEFSTTPKDNLLPVFETIQSFLRIANGAKIEELHSKALERYSQSEDAYLKLAYLDLMRAFLPFLNETDLESLFAEVVEPLLSDKNCRLQKKGYRLIEELCRSSSPACKEYVQKKLQSILLALMCGLKESAPPAKSAALNALRNVIVQFFVVLPQEIDVILGKLVPLVFQALEIKSARTRVASLELMKTLVSLSLQNDMCHLLMSSMKQYLTDKSSACKALLCITFTFSQLVKNVAGKDLLSLFNLVYTPTDSKVVVKSVTEFTKVALKELPEDQTHCLFELVMNWITRLKPRQRASCRISIKDLVVRFIKKFGFDTVATRLPADLSHVLRNLKKKESRKKAVPVEEFETVSRASKRSRRATTASIIHSSSSESEDDEPVNSKSKRLQLEENIDDYDLLEKPSYKVESRKMDKKEQPIDPLIHINSEGKIVLQDMMRKRKLSEAEDEEEVDMKSQTHSNATGMSASTSYRHGGRGIHRVPDKSEASGRDYKSRKGKSDEKRKGVSTDPYAYVPLDRAVLNKRRKGSMKGQFKQLTSRKHKQV